MNEIYSKLREETQTNPSIPRIRVLKVELVDKEKSNNGRITTYFSHIKIRSEEADFSGNFRHFRIMPEESHDKKRFRIELPEATLSVEEQNIINEVVRLAQEHLRVEKPTSHAPGIW